MGSETKMDRAIFKKNIHFSQKEELHCAQMIIDGADLHRVSEWHKLRFGKPMSESKFYRKRKMAAQIVAESKNKKPTPARQQNDSISKFGNDMSTTKFDRVHATIRRVFIRMPCFKILRY